MEIHGLDRRSGFELRSLHSLRSFRSLCDTRFARVEPPDSHGLPGNFVLVAHGVSRAFGAEAIESAAESTTGYVTVTAEIVAVTSLGESGEGVKAVLRDESGAMDMVAWNDDDDWTGRLKDYEGDCVVIRDAKVGEYEGKRQLRPAREAGVTTLQEIQQGIWYTLGMSPGKGQADLAASADGGEICIRWFGGMSPVR